MKKNRHYQGIRLALLGIIITCSQMLMAQYSMPAVMDSASLENQLEYVQERTRIYNDFRAIREDIFQKLKGNVLDSLAKERLEVAHLNSVLTERNFQIENLSSDLARAKSERDQAIRTKDSFTLLGIQMQKALYSTVTWIILLGLALLVVLLFLMFKRSHAVTSHTKKEFENTLEEFEEYKKSSREKYEKLVVSHHNEIMKLKRG
jgi:hypothetical protein